MMKKMFLINYSKVIYLAIGAKDNLNSEDLKLGIDVLKEDILQRIYQYIINTSKTIGYFFRNYGKTKYYLLNIKIINNLLCFLQWQHQL